MSFDHYSNTRLYDFVHKLNMYVIQMEISGTNTFVYLNGQEYTKDFIIKMRDHVLHHLLIRDYCDFHCCDLPCQEIKDLL